LEENMERIADNIHLNVIEFLNSLKEEQEKLLIGLQSMQNNSKYMDLEFRKLSSPENPTNPQSWTKMESELTSIYSSVFGVNPEILSTRICDICEKTLDLTASNVDYTCNECGFRSDICNECQKYIFGNTKLTQEHSLRMLKQCPEGVGCQDIEMREVVNKYGLVS